MKKVLFAVSLCVLAAAVYAQSPSADARWFGEALESLRQNKASANLEANLEKAIFPKLRLGKHYFEISQAAEEALNQEQKVWTYVYRPVKTSVVYREKVATDVHTGLPEIVGHVGIVSPFKWEYADFEVSEIEITVYPDNRIQEIAQDWKNSFGENCISTHPYKDTKVVNMMHTPTRAILTADGRTAVISIHASSKKFGPYRAKCHQPTWAGRIYLSFDWMARQLDVAKLPQMQYAR